MAYRAVKGMKDVLPAEAALWRRIEETARRTLEQFAYREIRVPFLEYTELFARGIGEQTDIVEKEMYTFEDSKGVRVSLRPEGTAGVVRACVEHHLLEAGGPVKLYYMGPMFRHERPQKGRYRQFHQIGAEALGSSDPRLDAEVLALLHLLFERLGVRGLVLEINSLGCGECRPAYREALESFAAGVAGRLCPDCTRRAGRNPLRLLDCKREACREAMRCAPQVLTTLCRECMEHFETVKQALEDVGVPFEVNGRLVRGLDYYTRTAFEFVAPGLGAQNAVAAGGRYDGLVEELGGPPAPAVGFALGMERLAALVPEAGGDEDGVQVFVAPLGESARARVPAVLHGLRRAGVRAEADYQGRSLKAQMRRADRMGARFAAMLGDDELARGVILLRDLRSREQGEVPLDRLSQTMAARLAGEGA